MDEALSALTQFQLRIEELLRELKEQYTIIMSPQYSKPPRVSDMASLLLYWGNGKGGKMGYLVEVYDKTEAISKSKSKTTKYVTGRFLNVASCIHGTDTESFYMLKLCHIN